MTGKEVCLRVRSGAYADVDLGPLRLEPGKPTVFRVHLQPEK